MHMFVVQPLLSEPPLNLSFPKVTVSLGLSCNGCFMTGYHPQVHQPIDFELAQLW